ncbi:MAG: efflux RND transporter periplasmic adaptor subunit [Thiomonas sp.]|jgi:membrane fusion protein (multidrug efflux system)|uniref:Efflux transporter, RND family, MFP subunit n=1 Tax=Thiomonas intermedia (strain K12) TaxID=75379 RepID=D5X702_THIK1|nr:MULTISPECIES: efflux RND transporter periplasmic adaptor subunit [Thiomonas]MDE1978008.1 efflux RND transporter periplasmic adaptor subunit [Betaproteobacteria bacterium]OYV31492.1 MAG: MexH family multidrug efflux RND transporter periplasmic adaptor subunit [Thiomonas sp. 20-64-9]MBN8775128.1 efflux RND transporter periplasmic adaptor subunit [Thiomonas arsenitoxydans]MDE2269582.1 efflux RND transporter periplasmic adaptor subunit [Betaproteobacteria bacterium]OZB71867.1 MAG: MexH family m
MTKGTTKRMIIMLIIAAVLIGGMVWFQHFKSTMIAKAIKGMSNPPQTVSTIVAQESSWQPTVEALGNLRASQQASLSPQIAGVVTAIHFRSGEKVRAGQVLAQINDAPQRAQLAQLQAQVGQLQAQLNLAQITLARDEAQLKVQAISQAVVDTDRANVTSVQAQLKALAEQINAQKAVLAQATVTAPFAGVLGIRQVNLGQYLAPGTAVVTLQALDPMDIDFTVPQNQIDLVHVGMKAELTTNAAPGKTFEAKVIAVEPQINTATRNLTVRARIPNPKGELLPGVFATIRLTDGEPRNYITLPNAAVAYNPYGATVFLVKDEGKGADGKPKLVAEQRFITTGLTRGDQVAVLSGLKAGDTVVTAGQLKLRNGVPVLINNSVQPSDNPNPQVPNS